MHWTMNPRRPLMAAVLAACPALACASAEQFQGLVKERAAFDLQCESSSLEVTELPGAAYGVRGCGKQATYIISGAMCQNRGQLTRREVKRYCTPALDHVPALRAPSGDPSAP